MTVSDWLATVGIFASVVGIPLTFFLEWVKAVSSEAHALCRGADAERSGARWHGYPSTDRASLSP
jgi:hypothetical protein